jgi:hypothetical protein
MPVVPPASRSLMSARSRLRVVPEDSTARFIGVDEITRQHILDCPNFAELRYTNPTEYIAEFGGMLGIVKGASFNYGITVFSENLKHMTVVDSSRVSGSKVKFNHGSAEFKEAREDCWELCVKVHRIIVITEVERQNPVEYPLVLSRPEDTTCPICFDDLSGNVVCCIANHQTCLPCFNLLPATHGTKKCVRCNVSNYSIDEYARVAQMNGIQVERPPYFYFNMYGSNSMKKFINSEALFLHAIKNSLNFGLDYYNQMLLSSFYNWYLDNKKLAFESFNFNLTHYTNDDYRSYNPVEDDLGDAVYYYIEALYKPDEFKKICDDVAYTAISMYNYDDTIFYPQLEDIDGNINRITNYPNQYKMVLQREIFFTYKIKHSNALEIANKFKEMFRDIIIKSTRNQSIFKAERRILN